MRRFIPVCVVVTYVVLAGPAAAAIVNGGFETGDFTGWTEFDDGPLLFDQGVDDAFPHTGEWAAFFGHRGGSGGIEQTASNDGLSVLTFWLRNTAASQTPVNSFVVEIDSTPFTILTDAGNQRYTQHFIPFSPSGPTTTVRFIANNEDGFFDLDDVQFQQSEPVPEPCTLALWSLTALGARVFYRRRRKAAA